MMIRNHITEKILVVDDNHTTRDIICRFLKGQGYKVSHAADGSGALERFSQDTFDLVLADFAMPGSAAAARKSSRPWFADRG